MNCCICLKGPADGTTIYRVAPLGTIGPWACKEHLKQAGAPDPHPDVCAIVECFENDAAEKP